MANTVFQLQTVDDVRTVCAMCNAEGMPTHYNGWSVWIQCTPTDAQRAMLQLMHALYSNKKGQWYFSVNHDAKLPKYIEGIA